MTPQERVKYYGQEMDRRQVLLDNNAAQVGWLSWDGLPHKLKSLIPVLDSEYSGYFQQQYSAENDILLAEDAKAYAQAVAKADAYNAANPGANLTADAVMANDRPFRMKPTSSWSDMASNHIRDNLNSLFGNTAAEPQAEHPDNAPSTTTPVVKSVAQLATSVVPQVTGKPSTARPAKSADELVDPNYISTGALTTDVAAKTGSKTTGAKTTGAKSTPVSKTAAKKAATEVVKQVPVSTAPPALQFGALQHTIPHGEFTHSTPHSNVTIDPIGVYGDNGGSQHAAMQGLYRDKNEIPSLGSVLAFTALLQGKKGLASFGDLRKVMHDADAAHAYANQANVVDRTKFLISQGRTPEEARYEALTEYLLSNGQGRAALGVTMPEYQKQADASAARSMDIAAAVGGDYHANGGFGYSPYGVDSFSINDEYGGDITLRGNKITRVPVHQLQQGIGGLIKGGGAGSTKSADTNLEYDKKAWELEKYLTEAKVDTAKTKAGVGSSGGRSGRMTPEEYAARKEADYELWLRKEMQKEAMKKGAGAGGNTTGIDLGVPY